MKLLDNYIFNPHLRYENHTLIFSQDQAEPVSFGGILAASVMASLLSVADEGEARGLVLDTPAGRDDFFRRYENEVLADNGGLFSTEVQALSEAYVEFFSDEDTCLRICRNDRLLDRAIGLTVEYMQRLVREQVGEQIYDVVPWTEPFAQWLYNAGFVETRRQHLLSIDWTDPAAVYSLADELSSDRSPLTDQQSPLFLFSGLSSDQVLNSYWSWLNSQAEQIAGEYPDAPVQLAEIRQTILQHETDPYFLKSEISQLPPAAINLFNRWMTLWTDFIQDKIQPPTTRRQRKEEEQLFFPDTILQCPTADMTEKYAATREYIRERSRYDEKFRKFSKNESFARFCRQLTLLFGWHVEPDSLRKSMLRRPKRKTKKYV